MKPAISNWPSAPPTIFATEPEKLEELVDLLEYTPGVGRNIIACELSEDAFIRAIDEALKICRNRKERGIEINSGLVPTNQNMSPSWLFQLMLKELPE